jgi:hypothetical protein
MKSAPMRVKERRAPWARTRLYCPRGAETRARPTTHSRSVAAGALDSYFTCQIIDTSARGLNRPHSSRTARAPEKGPYVFVSSHTPLGEIATVFMTPCLRSLWAAQRMSYCHV